MSGGKTCGQHILYVSILPLLMLFSVQLVNYRFVGNGPHMGARTGVWVTPRHRDTVHRTLTDHIRAVKTYKCCPLAAPRPGKVTTNWSSLLSLGPHKLPVMCMTYERTDQSEFVAISCNATVITTHSKREFDMKRNCVLIDCNKRLL